MPRPAISGALPCTASKMAWSWPRLAPGARPKPPIRPAQRSDRISPKRLVVTMMSKRSGFITSCMAQLSTIISSNAMSGYACEISRPVLRNSPEVDFIILALWTRVTFFRESLRAVSKACRMMLAEPALVMMLLSSARFPSSERLWPCPEYRPSRFSRTTIRSRSWYRALVPGSDKIGRTLA